MKALKRLQGAPEPNQTWTTASGHVLAGDCTGDKAKQAVVLLHGIGQTRHAWKGASEALAAAGFYAVSLDARGHGDSGWAADGVYTLEDMIDDITLVVNQLKLVKPILIGASMGGMISMVAIATGKVDAGALVTVDIAPTMNKSGRNKIESFMQQGQQGFDELEHVAAAIANYQPQRQAKRSFDGLSKNVRQGDDGRYYWHWDPALFDSLGQEFEQFEADLQHHAAALTLPILLVRGALSDVVTDQEVADFKALCPHLEYENVAGAAHMIAGDRNDAFINAIEKFVNNNLAIQAQ